MFKRLMKVILLWLVTGFFDQGVTLYLVTTGGPQAEIDNVTRALYMSEGSQIFISFCVWLVLVSVLLIFAGWVLSIFWRKEKKVCKYVGGFGVAAILIYAILGSIWHVACATDMVPASWVNGPMPLLSWIFGYESII